MRRFQGFAQRRFAGPRLQHREGKPARPPALAREERLDDGRGPAPSPTPELDERRFARLDPAQQPLDLGKKMVRLAAHASAVRSCDGPSNGRPSSRPPPGAPATEPPGNDW